MPLRNVPEREMAVRQVRRTANIRLACSDEMQFNQAFTAM